MGAETGISSRCAVDKNCPHAKAGVCLLCQLAAANTRAAFLAVQLCGAADDIEKLAAKAVRAGSLEKVQWNDRVKQLRASANGESTAETARRT